MRFYVFYETFVLHMECCMSNDNIEQVISVQSQGANIVCPELKSCPAQFCRFSGT